MSSSTSSSCVPTSTPLPHGRRPLRSTAPSNQWGGTLRRVSTTSSYLRGIGAVLVLTVAGACTTGGVPWEDYSPSVRADIDALAAAGDCAGLQQQFDTADANNDATMARTGHNNVELMKYIDGKMSDAGCYG